MIDHVLGRPSVRFRKYQVFAVVAFWSFYLYKGNRHGPAALRRLSTSLHVRLTPWQSLVLTLLYLYTTRNFGKLIGLECPEPLANLYTRAYFRATWVTTALDAGFWTAMNIRHKRMKDFCSIVFTVYYLICAEQADEKVRKIRAGLTLQHLRVSWDKPTTPYIAFFTRLMRPSLMRYPPRRLRIPRPPQSSYQDPIDAWLYFDGPISALKKHDKLVLDIPGGGFVAMDPRAHDDKLLAWAGRTGLPVLALNYKKAPEHPYPYALNECYDAYHALLASRGRCVGLSGEVIPKIIISGDSAGGNLAVGMVMMILQSGSTNTRRWQGESSLPLPEGVVLVYPALDMNIGNWMTDEQMALIKDRRMRKTNQAVLRRKSEDYRKLTPQTPHGSDDEDEIAAPSPSRLSRRDTSTSMKLLGDAAALGASPTTTTKDDPAPSAAHILVPITPANKTAAAQQAKPQQLRTRLAMSSMISYFNDRILTPEMMRAMIILYIGPYNKPDFATDFLLSPLLAPEGLLARFPKLYMLTGERDPLVDDTVIFAGRIRQAKLGVWRERVELGLESDRAAFDETRHVHVMLVPGISHGFLQFVTVFPEGRRYILQCGRWMREIFREAEAREARAAEGAGREGAGGYFEPVARSRRMDSEGDEDRPLEMSALSAAGKSPAGQGQGPGRGRAAVRNAAFSGRTSPLATRKSLVSLASMDDLLGRRMEGLTGGLMGDYDGGLDTP